MLRGDRDVDGVGRCGFEDLGVLRAPPSPPLLKLCEVAAPPRRRTSSNFANLGRGGGAGIMPKDAAGLTLALYCLLEEL